jgi:hypothetical protein
MPHHHELYGTRGHDSSVIASLLLQILTHFVFSFFSRHECLSKAFESRSSNPTDQEEDRRGFALSTY